jgi:hypothetical protein
MTTRKATKLARDLSFGDVIYLDSGMGKTERIVDSVAHNDTQRIVTVTLFTARGTRPRLKLGYTTRVEVKRLTRALADRPGPAGRGQSLREFIREHRADIDQAIRRVVRHPGFTINDAERRQWILNDEGLYRWARSEGVRI